mmetsp:Transcript_961/g.3313  ORF Transcript_961/g.3313 Transcript_961/m.3313 type:complete len:630 (-) Transcript_961:52-1941(-)|eukprot:CAMPEP_0117453822 /NCGR_PEP_ID=MMETSP0759-20121206/10441_1 /TAXON_ID=63605 /ORGANISM="Percolomonas cosmopolitus, Strain WS" /LENGTH=629 /DNA_ID=CAMNT_0005246905 /DNA_START=30 /DNA_END=1919 /DNA_ORIENTATION=+
MPQIRRFHLVIFVVSALFLLNLFVAYTYFFVQHDVVKNELQLNRGKPENVERETTGQSTRVHTELSSTPQEPDSPFWDNAAIAFIYTGEDTMSLLESIEILDRRWHGHRFFVVSPDTTDTINLLEKNWPGKLNRKTSRMEVVSVALPSEASQNPLGFSLAQAHLSQLFALDEKLEHIMYVDHRHLLALGQSILDILPSMLQSRTKETHVSLYFDKATRKISPHAFVLHRDQEDIFSKFFLNFLEMVSFHTTDGAISKAFQLAINSQGYTLPGSGSHPKSTLSSPIFRVHWISSTSFPQLVSSIQRTHQSQLTIEHSVYPLSRSVTHFEALKDGEGRPLDALIVHNSPISCFTRQLVDFFNIHLLPRRLIFVVSSLESCTTLLAFAENVRCMTRKEAIPHFHPDSIRYLIPDGAPQNSVDSFHKQFINLWASHYQGLSEHYLVWDESALPIAYLHLFRGQAAIMYTGPNHDKWASVAHHTSFKYLTGMAPLCATDLRPHREGSVSERPTWIANFAIFKKEYVVELLDHIVKYRKCASHAWTREIVNVFYEQHALMHGVVFHAFEHYGSWMAQKHAENIVVDFDSWSRVKHLFAGAFGNQWSENPLEKWCISQDMLKKNRFYGVEILERST